MNNAGLTAILGILFVSSLAIRSMVLKAENRIEEQNAVISAMVPIDGDVLQSEGDFLSIHDIETLSIGYTPLNLTSSTYIDVPVINQFPELPVGCEITSATALLQYLGYSVDKMEMTENFLPQSYDFYMGRNGKQYGPDPNKVFVGDPEKTGLGCLSPVIVRTLNAYFRSVESGNRAIDVKNANQSTLETLLDYGIPIQVWASRNMRPFRYIEKNEWTVTGTDELFRWPGNSHSLVLIGYDNKNYYFADCDDKSEIQHYKKSDFLNRWEEFGSQAVIIQQFLPEDETL